MQVYLLEVSFLEQVPWLEQYLLSHKAKKEKDK